jgi:hypothetical protein
LDTDGQIVQIEWVRKMAENNMGFLKLLAKETDRVDAEFDTDRT